MQITIGNIGQHLTKEFRYGMEYKSYQLTLDEGRNWLENLRPGNYDSLSEKEVEVLLQQVVTEELADPERKKFRNECLHQQFQTEHIDMGYDPADEMWMRFDMEEMENKMQDIFSDRPDFAEMVISIVLHDEKPSDFASRKGLSRSSVSQKMGFAKKRIKKIYQDSKF